MDYGDIARAIAPIHDALDHRCLNEIEGLEVPTSEVLAKWIFDRLRSAVPHLAEVHVAETCTARCEYRGADQEGRERSSQSHCGRARGCARARVDRRGDWCDAAIEPPAVASWPSSRGPVGGSSRTPATLAEGLYDRDPATWLRPGHEALEAAWAALAPRVRSTGGTVCFVPHARHVLSDVQSSAHFHRERPDDPLEIALAPADLLEVDMLDDVEVHLTRMFETLGPITSSVMLEDVADEVDGHGLPRRCPLGAGRLPRDVVLDLLGRCVSPAHADRRLRGLVRGRPGMARVRRRRPRRIDNRRRSGFDAFMSTPTPPSKPTPSLDHPTLPLVKEAFPDLALKASEFRGMTTLIVHPRPSIESPLPA